MKDLLERELNGELTASEALELNRCADEETLRRRREWRSVSETLSEEAPCPSTGQARIARGVRDRLNLKDAQSSPGIARVLPWAALACCTLALAILGTWTEPNEENEEEVEYAPISIAADVSAQPQAGPVEIGVFDTPLAPDEELIEVVF